MSFGAETIAMEHTILRGLVGSTVHGIAVAATDDRDEMGVCIEPPEHVIGLEHFERYVYRTQPEGVRSGPGDLDLVVYSLRKWCRLALKGNPTVLLLLFVPEAAVVTCTPLGRELRTLAPALAARSAGNAFLGYVTAQKQRMLGQRGGHRTTRLDLVAAHGYDTKCAGHMLRLGYQGHEFLETGRITLPMPERERQRVLAVRRGEVPVDEVLAEAASLEQGLATLRRDSPLPAEPDRMAVNDFLMSAYQRHWREGA
jgi:hypothetical protein